MATQPASARFATALVFGPALLWIAVASAGIVAAATATRAPPDRGRTDAAGSAQCRRCHPEQYASWHGSFHRTMTQPAAGDAVLAPFAGERLVALGFEATMTGGPDEPHVAVRNVSDGRVLIEADVELTVGSHRYQQFVARIDRGGGPWERWRLPLAWHIETSRWIHLSGAFLTPDGEPGNGEDYLRHLSRWSDNCIFCHNTEPAPGLAADGRFAPRIAEFGIACEACHGKAAAHIARHDDPFARLLTARATRPVDDTVTQPARLSAGAHADVCGRCHGQRIAADIAAVMQHGDGFVPGEPLSAVSRPIVADAQLSGLPPDPFAARFWPDGTPRLSAYEYQGLLLSPCFAEGEGLSCGDCHTMHGPDPDGQLRVDYTATRVCGRCHEAAQLSPGPQGTAHGGHGAAVDCAGCHLPRVTYGLLQGMMSHRIQSPDPGALVGRGDQPDACTQCHVERARAWAAASMPTLGLASTPAPGPADREAWAPRVVLDLLGGDPIQRVLAAHALARPEAVGAWRPRMQWLTQALADEYPAVRWMAWRGLVSLGQGPDAPASAAAVVRTLADYDFMAPLPDRIAAERALTAAFGAAPTPTEVQRSALAADRDDKAIWIGE